MTRFRLISRQLFIKKILIKNNKLKHSIKTLNIMIEEQHEKNENIMIEEQHEKHKKKQ